MAKEIKAGRYTASIVNYGITQKEGKDPQVAILFEFEDQDRDRHEMTWFGTLKEGKGQEITLKALLACGMTGNDVAALADGVESNVLDAATPVSIVMAQQTYEGKTHMRVQWVNTLRTGFQGKLDKGEAKVKLGALNLNAQLAFLRNELGIKDQPRSAMNGTQSMAPVDTNDDLPW